MLGGLGPGLLYFDPTVYSLPAAGVQGNMKRHSGPEGPGFWQLDGVAVQALRGRRHAVREFRVDAYNVTNSVRWGNPNTGFSTATGNTFGQITGTTGGQRTVRFGDRSRSGLNSGDPGRKRVLRVPGSSGSSGSGSSGSGFCGLWALGSGFWVLGSDGPALRVCAVAVAGDDEAPPNRRTREP